MTPRWKSVFKRRHFNVRSRKQNGLSVQTVSKQKDWTAEQSVVDVIPLSNSLIDESVAAESNLITDTSLELRTKVDGKDRKVGVNVCYDCGPDATIDIVFVHGLDGNAFNTWYDKETEAFWPGHLLNEDLPQTRILSYGYNVDIYSFVESLPRCSLLDLAEELVGDLARFRETTNSANRRICFVMHSLGGLLAIKALLASRSNPEEHCKKIEQSTSGMIFLGVPFGGSDLANSTTALRNVLGLVANVADKRITRNLKPRSEELYELRRYFYYLLRNRIAEKSKIYISSFYEELETPVMEKLPTLFCKTACIVSKYSATLYGYPSAGLNADHRVMKFDVQS